MAKGLVLITGVSGHVGFRILATALATNYRVRATVRNPDQINVIKAAKSIQLYLNSLEIVIVPDMFKVTDNPQTDIIDPAVNGTTNVLSCAYKFPAIKRIVITSSSSVLMARGAQSFPNVLTENDVVPRPSPPYGNDLEAYMNGKVLALHASLDWVEANQPSFDIINMPPAFVIGSHELATNVKDTISGSNNLVLGPLLGNRNLDPAPFATVHVEDVARAHIKALDPKIKGNQAFLLSSESEGGSWDDAVAIVRKSFPAVEEKSFTSLNGTQPTTKISFDSSKAEIQLGIAFRSYEEQVHSLVSHYLAIVTAV